MIRQPSPLSQVYAWHRLAINGEAPPIHDGLPEAGWFKTRLVRGGPWVPVEIRLEREIDLETGELTAPERLVAICEGRRRNPVSLWTYLQPITRAEHAELVQFCANTPAMAATMAKINLPERAIRP